MTLSSRAHVERLQRRPAKNERMFAAYDLRAALLEQIRATTGTRWPSARYREDPVAFAREVLGVDPWWKQVELLEAIRDHKRGAVRSGHKVSKSHSIAIIALWFYCSFPDAKVVLSSTTARQVDDILWLEIRKMLARGGKCVACKEQDPEDKLIPRPCVHSTLIEERPGDKAKTGLRSLDFRFIVGFTAREAEAVAGVSGKNLLYLIDEASGVGDPIFEAIDGNRAGGARLWMFSNPTRNEGEHYDAFNSKSDLYKTITISSEDTPNAQEGREVIPGLATREWIEEKKEEYGEDSAFYKIRVKGVHAEKEEGKIFSVHRITEAEIRWKEIFIIEGETRIARDARLRQLGRLYLGIDLAGETGTGDEEVFVVRRGPFVFEITMHSGLTNEARLELIQATLGRFRLPNEKPVVVFDREGTIGSRFHGYVQNYVESNPGDFEAVAIRASDKAVRMPNVFDRMRDLLTGNLEDWFKSGGAIPEDTKLEKELHAVEWEQRLAGGRYKVTPKKEIKRLVGRSPDRYDALALACWEPMHLRDGIDEAPDSVREDANKGRTSRPQHDDDLGEGGGMDPYSSGRTFLL